MAVNFDDMQEIRMTEVEEETLVDEDLALDEAVSGGWHIVLYNDDHNTFDHVIDCLMAYCGHEVLQAEQCALIVHTESSPLFKGA